MFWSHQWLRLSDELAVGVNDVAVCRPFFSYAVHDAFWSHHTQFCMSIALAADVDHVPAWWLLPQLLKKGIM